MHMGKEIIFKLRASKTYQRRGMMRKVLCTLFVVQLLLFLPWENVFAFSFELFGKDLDVKGSIQQTLNIKTHEDQRDIRFNSFRSTLRGETLYKLVEGPDFNIQFYTLANYYYDYVLDIDSDHRHSVRSEAGGRHKYRDVRRPRDSDEWLSELYLDVKYKDFQVRLPNDFNDCLPERHVIVFLHLFVPGMTNRIEGLLLRRNRPVGRVPQLWNAA